jgi:hypothetical protein
MNATVKWADGARATGLRAEVAAEVFGRLAAEHNLTTESVVEEARSADSPLHPAFEWDDPRAAHQYRLDQARHLIRALVVIPDNGQPPVQIYVHVSDVGRYEPTHLLVQQPDRWRLAYEDAQRDLQSAARKIRALDSYSSNNEVRSAVDSALYGIGIAIDALEAVG